MSKSALSSSLICLVSYPCTLSRNFVKEFKAQSDRNLTSIVFMYTKQQQIMATYLLVIFVLYHQYIIDKENDYELLLMKAPCHLFYWNI